MLPTPPPTRHEYIVWCGTTALQYSLYCRLIEYDKSIKKGAIDRPRLSDSVLVHPVMAYQDLKKVLNEAVRVCVHVPLSV
jgi:hypothetical protein